MIEEFKDKRVALIDGDLFAYYILHDKNIKDELGNVIGKEESKTFQQACDKLDDFINNILKATKAEAYVIALTIHKCFRYKIFPDYKANRKKLEKPPFFYEFRENLRTKYKAVFHEDLEADDIINILKKNLPNSFIVSPDGDLLKLEGTHYNPKTNKWVTTDSIEANTKFWKDMICGQTGDNIKGLPGKGSAYFDKLVSGIELTDGSWLHQPYYIRVLQAYCDYYKDINRGIDEFYRTFQCLRILDEYKDFDINNISINLVKTDFNV